MPLPALLRFLRAAPADGVADAGLLRRYADTRDEAAFELLVRRHGREFRPDLIVSDYAMPGLDGLAAIAEVNRERRVPAILLSGRHDAESQAATTDAVVAFLQKPVKEPDLKAAVEAVAAGAGSAHV